MRDSFDARFIETRDREPTDTRDLRSVDARDVFAAGLDLPRGHDRERVYVRAHESYELRGSEVRSLATIGAFRVVRASDLRDDHGRPGDVRHGDLERLRSVGLIRRVTPDEGDTRTDLVALTDRGRGLLEHHRASEHEHSQRFYAGPGNLRELNHDAQLHRAYLRSARRLSKSGARIHRVVLENELKREYQEFLQAHNRDRADSDGRPTRSREEVEQWADAQDLPMLDDSVQFPDLRIEYEGPDGRLDHEDVEVMTVHYRGAHAAAKGSAGFTCYRGSSARIGGASGRGSQGRPFDPDVAEEFL